VVNSASVHACSQSDYNPVLGRTSTAGWKGGLNMDCVWVRVMWQCCHFDSGGCLVFCSGMCNM